MHFGTCFQVRGADGWSARQAHCAAEEVGERSGLGQRVPEPIVVYVATDSGGICESTETWNKPSLYWTVRTKDEELKTGDSSPTPASESLAIQVTRLEFGNWTPGTGDRT